jgi:hypothetical protein
MTSRSSGDHLRLVRHQLAAPRCSQGGRRGQ